MKLQEQNLYSYAVPVLSAPTRLIDISGLMRIVQETPQRETMAFGLAVTKVVRNCERSAAIQGVGTHT